jgi:hypothetical protein
VRIEAKLGLVTLKVLKASSQTSLCPASRSSDGVGLGLRPQAPSASARSVSMPISRTLGWDLSRRGGSAGVRRP